MGKAKTKATVSVCWYCQKKGRLEAAGELFLQDEASGCVGKYQAKRDKDGNITSSVTVGRGRPVGLDDPRGSREWGGSPP